ncbi:hypothetical protein F4777DRAFT_568544 [Nemania sp. FL0916]|nr:hypothetical protein F4777DRAFT_568544 [Nemania sp. FL0916]
MKSQANILSLPPNFEEQGYWQERFASKTTFEWLVPSATFMSLVAPYLSASARQKIPNLGSGTSDLHTHFRARGYHDVTSLDYEPRALDRGRDLEEEAFGDAQMHYAVADVTKLADNLGRPEAFDLIVDKGTADAVACGGDVALRSMVLSVRDCFAADGVWISIIAQFLGYAVRAQEHPFRGPGD